MKIALVHNLPPGGQKRALFEQVKRLSKIHEIDLFTLSSTDESYLPLKPFIRKHETVSYLVQNHFPLSVLSIYRELPGAYRLLAEKINKGNYDVAFVQPDWLTQAPYILRYLKMPSLYFCPEPKREFYEKIPRVSNRMTYALTLPFRLPIKKIDNENTRSATLVVTNSKYSKDNIDRIYKVNSEVNYLGVDTGVFKPSNVEKINAVLTVGGFSLLKGHDFIIRSLANIPQNIRPVFVVIGHGGVEKGYLEHYAKKNKVEIIIEENIPDKQLVYWYNKVKVFVYAPLKEPFGLAPLEAIACGLPVVAVKEGGIPEVLNSVKRSIMVNRNETLFSQRVVEFLTSTETDAENLKEFGKNWNWEKSVEELEMLLQKNVL